MTKQRIQGLVDYHIQQAIHLFEQNQTGSAFLKYHQAITLISASNFSITYPAMPSDFVEAMNDIEDTIASYQLGD